MARFIVTVKTARNPEHDPRNKKTASCIATENSTCTDSTGEHHSFLTNQIHASDEIAIARIHNFCKRAMLHVTRIEKIEKEITI